MEENRNEPVKAWSYSALTSFETCPKRHYLTRVTKSIIEPQSEALTYGSAVHTAIEMRLKEDKPLPESLQFVETMLHRITNRPYDEMLVEQKVALNSLRRPTGFFSNDCWLRGVLDFALITGDKMLILDWKTGKRRTDSDQLKLFALLGFHLYPVSRIHTGFVWLQANSKKFDSTTFLRSDLDNLWGDFTERVNRLNRAYEFNNWPARPSGLCKAWCPCTACIHNGKKNGN